MNSKPKSQNLKEIEPDNTLSIDEFFKQLEAKEKDLDISSDMVIEFEDSDLIESAIPDFIKGDLPPVELETNFYDNSDYAHSGYTENALEPIENKNLKAEIIELKNRITKMETERVELFENARRRQTDFENYKKRTERERGETFRAQISNLATQMLPVVDNLNRALDSSEFIKGESSNDFRQFFDGIFLVSQQLNEILAEMGVQPIAAVGESFDPHLHEAVATEISDEIASNTITQELLRGYRIGERVVRPSMVKVSASSNTGKLPEVLLLSKNNLTEIE